MDKPRHGNLVGRLTLLMGSAGAASVLLTVIVAGRLTPGYSHAAQFISELGASEAPYEWPVRLAGFLPAGLALLTFCGLAYRSLPPSPGATFGLLGVALFAAGYLVAAAFPCDPGCRPSEPSVSQSIHNAAGLLGYVFAPAALFALGRASRKWPDAGSMASLSFAAAAVALLGLLTLSPSSPVVGISQRVLEGAVLGWVVVCGVYIARRTGGSGDRSVPRASRPAESGSAADCRGE